MQDDFSELTHDELTRTTGGFLPLLGLLGMGSGLVGQILNGVAKKKQQQSEQLLANAQAQAPQTAAPTAPTADA